MIFNMKPYQRSLSPQVEAKRTGVMISSYILAATGVGATWLFSKLAGTLLFSNTRIWSKYPVIRNANIKTTF